MVFFSNIFSYFSSNVDFVLLMFLILFLTIFMFVEKRRGKVELQKIVGNIIYIVLYKTTWGLDHMDSFAKKHKKFFSILIPITVFLGVTGMIFISYLMIKSFIDLFIKTKIVQAAAIVLPIKTSFTFYVPFEYWIISIFLLATVHEMAHGIIARYYNIKIKSSGFAFLSILLPIIPAAFVEPDEKDLEKKPAKQQIAVFSAGPVSNFFFAIIAFLLLFSLSALFQPSGLMVQQINTDSYLLNTSFNYTNEKITGINNNTISTLSDLKKVLDNTKPGEKIVLKTNKSEYNVILLKHPEKNSGYIGASFYEVKELNPDLVFLKPIKPLVLWINGLLYFLVILNLGIGLFNLLPLLIADGGRIYFVILKDYFKFAEEKAMKITAFTGLIFFLMLLALLIFPHIAFEYRIYITIIVFTIVLLSNLEYKKEYKKDKKNSDHNNTSEKNESIKE